MNGGKTLIRGQFSCIKFFDEIFDEIFLNFPKLFIIENYVKIRFKNRGALCYFLSSRGQKIKILQKLKERDCLHSWF